ncbi:MAG TPA: Lrp/AsnC family transcriptional regulator [Gammaproteobacteria bacterium]|jgi:DNA-binding Lrp family transcriptional regulator|uniref:Transcriptional regulators n=1 Tax=uncultured Oceanospirillales bacterium HF4000_23O15 TaxID=710746 RepID=E0XW00_9GAMM|nr:transcriptional regulators [uncultured Oceanospirillales bacterium HF4000_23O15]HIF85382.1 Lrp/AsnC family transcriptional regulator [Gammaproteobacteria bacterium]HIL62578.1 Lrp/AsnC family transcriptional regulator [Porticoccaceae bacterium]|tara:strand:- start:3928 stop:4374 length:447 start_codon:yes stop_codon:yes gene_type:complete
MDKIDKNLLALLRINARLSTSELARRLGISRSTVQSRLKRLENRKVISAYTVQYGREYEGKLIRAHVLLQVSQKLTGKAYVILKKMPEITSLYAISGEYDLIAIVTAESTEELSRLLDDIANLAGIERTNSSVILETKFARGMSYYQD